jgi:hypothetical protein
VGWHEGVGDGERGRGLPSFVPPRFALALGRAAQRWNVSAALLAAQLYAESNFNPFASSPAGAQGIAQFMPATARAYGLADPFDADAGIDAQGRMMRDLLRQFGSVPLALAAYNAGPGVVARCGCIPPYPETRGYVARILGLLGGAGEAALVVGWRCGSCGRPKRSEGDVKGVCTRRAAASRPRVGHADVGSSNPPRRAAGPGARPRRGVPEG